MFERQFGLRENPFAAGHQSRFVYPSREHQEALAHLRYGIENREPFVLITGEVGTGKTTALYDVLSEWQSRVTVALITNSALTRDELLEEICVRFGVPIPQAVTKPQLMIQLERHLHAVRARGDRAILLLDEAQNLHRDLLEEIRLLSNLEAQGDKLMQVFLVGQPELETLLSRPELRQLRQRIAVHYRLHPLSDDDTERYIHHRITVAGGHALTIFPAEACAVVHQLTHGIPREINTVCSQAMLNAFVEDSGMVLPEHVHAVARETEFQSVVRGEAAASSTRPDPGAGTTAEPPRETPLEVPRVVTSPPPAPRAETPPSEEPAARPEPPAVRPAGTHQQWESVRATLASDRSRTPAPPMPAPPTAAWTPAPPEEISHESESETAHTRAAESWYGPEAEPPSRAPLPPDEPESVSERRPLWQQRPPEPEPEAPREPEAVREARQPSSTLPPSLRRKLEFLEEEEESRPNEALRWVAIALFAFVVVAGGVFAARYFTRSRATAAPREPATSPAVRSPAPADTVAKPPVVVTAPVTPPVTPPVTAQKPTPPPATPKTAAAPPKPAATPPATPPAPAETFAIAVASFLDETRAEQERAKLAAATGLAGRVVTVSEGGDQSFRVVLGSFTDRASAEKAAGTLIGSGTVDEARIVTLPR